MGGNLGRLIMALALALLAGRPALAQMPGGPPPAVGVVAAKQQAITQSSEYIARIQATNRVNLVARVAAYLDEVLFTDGAEVKKGQLLYRLEQGPFQADVQAKEASIAQFKAQLRNAEIVLQRAQALLKTPAGQQATVDTALAAQDALKAQILGAEAQLQQAQDQSRLHRDPRADRRQDRPHRHHRRQLRQSRQRHPGVDRQPGSDVRRLPGVDPHRDRAAAARRRQGGRAGDPRPPARRHPVRPAGQARLRRQHGGRQHRHHGAARHRARTPSACWSTASWCRRSCRTSKPTEALAVPRAAVLADQQGDYVFVVGKDNKVEKRPVKLGQSTPALAAVISGLTEGENVVVDGIQRVRPGLAVSPGPAAQQVPPPAGTAPAGGQAVISAAFIRRPRLAVVIAIVITIAGAIAMLRIPVAQFPDIVPPRVQVTGELSRRLGRRGRGRDRPAARGADRRRRQDDLHEVDQRQRRQLQPHRLVRGRHQSRHRHGQRQQPRADGDRRSCRRRCSCRACR